jgi:hypothetical protein
MGGGSIGMRPIEQEGEAEGRKETRRESAEYWGSGTRKRVANKQLVRGQQFSTTE